MSQNIILQSVNSVRIIFQESERHVAWLAKPTPELSGGVIVIGRHHPSRAARFTLRTPFDLTPTRKPALSPILCD
jgi:hypothetical protein